jgi:hypothetical protein
MGRPTLKLASATDESFGSSARTAKPLITQMATVASKFRRRERRRATPASRFYKPTQFDVLAVCLWRSNGPPRFVYRNTTDLERHAQHPDRLAVMHRIDATWATRLMDAA